MTPYFTDIEIVEEMPSAVYLDRPEISRSELVSLLQSSAKFPWNREHPKEATPAMVFGSMVHSLMLTPGEFDAEFLVSDSPSRRTKDWKEVVLEAKRRGVIAVLASDLEPTQACADAATEAFGPILEVCRKEVAVFGTHAETGVRVKVRLDLLHDDYIADLKTTKDASKDAFSRSVAKFRYDIQAALYGDLAGSLMGLEYLPFLFACVETEPPYLTAEWDLSEEWIENGRADYEWALNLYKTCEADGYPQTLGKGTLEPKPWQIGG